ncbi:MAG: SCP2 sterol-binding domain-containing protein [Pseudomonadota bacterium]
MTLEELTAKASEAVADKTSFGKKVKFDFGDQGSLFIDGPGGTAHNEGGDADATIKVSWDDFEKLRKGELDGTMAFMQGKLKVDGDMSVAMQLQSLMSKFA